MSARLPCGAGTDGLLEQVASTREADTEHQRSCPHCRATLEEYRRLWAPVDALADEVVRAPAAVVDRALARVRAVADHPTTGLLEADGLAGTTRIAARVVLSCARLAAEEVDGVRLALGRLTAGTDADPAPGDAPRVAVGLAGGTAVVRLTLAATYGLDLPALGREVRARVSRRLREVTGLRAVTVDVHVDAVFGPGGS